MSTSLHYIRIPESQLDEGLAAPGLIKNLFQSDAIPEDRMWDPGPTYCLINFLLTGTCWEGAAPLGHTIFGAHTIEALKADGSFRYLRATEAQDVWSALQPLSAETLWANFDLEAFQSRDPWPPGWTDSDEDRDFFYRKFAELKSFYERATSAREAIVLHISS